MFDTNFLILAYGFFKDFGFGLTGWAIIVWLLWKIATNHLHHIAIDLKTIGEDVKTVIKRQEDDKTELNEKIDGVESKVNSLGERTAKLEGQVQQ